MNNNKKKIMVVDDDQDIVESITIILESAGYEFKSADCSFQCFEILRKEKPDLIVLDIMMETIFEGFNVVYELKANPEYRLIPIVMVSSISKHMGFNVDKDFLQVDEFMEKPILPNEFLKNIEKLITLGG